MSKFYLTDPNINTLPMTDLQFKIYHYCCANYNVKKHEAFIRIVNIGGQFQLTKDEVQKELIELSKIKHLELPLIKIKELSSLFWYIKIIFKILEKRKIEFFTLLIALIFKFAWYQFSIISKDLKLIAKL